jgi:superfamily II DNA or RNA helicase
MELTLYPFQKKLIHDVKRSIAEKKKAPLVVAPTGAGKTIIFAHIAQGAKAKLSKVLILVHRREILEQTLEKLYWLGVQAGQIAPDRPMTRDWVQVAMVQTLRNRLSRAQKPDIIIVDEAHHAIAGSWGKVFEAWPDVLRIGFTATPERLDGTGLRECFDDMIQGPSVSDLVRDGFLSYPVMYHPPKEVIFKFRIKRGDFDVEQQEEVMSQRSIVGDVIGEYKHHVKGGPAVCFCVSIKHSEHMREAFSDAGIKAAHVWGGMPRTERERAIRGLADGTVQVVTSCDVISEGVDVPVMSGAILLRRTASLGLYLQQSGRALRTYPGKTKAIILDHAGNYYLHGHILSDRSWSLDHEKRQKNERAPKTTSCPKCFAIWPGEPRTCPDCGFAFSDNAEIAGQQRKDPRILEGQLIAALPKGTPADVVEALKKDIHLIMQMPPKTRGKYMLMRAAQLGDRGQMKALAGAIGYKSCWTDFVWNNILQKRR